MPYEQDHEYYKSYFNCKFDDDRCCTYPKCGCVLKNTASISHVYPTRSKAKLAEIVHSKSEAIDHPKHYGGEDNPYEAIKVIEAWGLDSDFYLGNVVKYICRAEHKQANLTDLKKARWYLDRKIAGLETASKKS